MKIRRILFPALTLAFCLNLTTPVLAAEEECSVNWLPKGWTNEISFDAPYFTDNLLCMNNDYDNCVYVDTQGKIVFSVSDAWSSRFAEGVAYHSEYKYDEGLIVAEYYDTQGNVIYHCEVEKPEELFKYGDLADLFRPFSEGLAATYLGYIDKTGTLVLSLPTGLKYSRNGNFSEGRAMVGVFVDTWKYGFIDKTGNEIVPCIYDYASDFHGGVAVVGNKTKDASGNTLSLGAIDLDGNVIIPLEYEWLTDFAGGVSEFRKRNQTDSKYDYTSGYLNKKGDWLTSYEYNFGGTGSSLFEMHPFSDDNYKTIRVDKKSGFCHNGEIVIPCQYDFAEEFSGGIAWVQKNGQRIAIDVKGRELFSVPGSAFSETGDFHDGVAPVRDAATGLWGYIDTAGNIVVPCQFTAAGLYNCGHSVVGRTYQNENGSEELQYGILKIPTPLSTQIAYANAQTVLVDGKEVSFECYALKDANGNDTNYIKLRDLADILDGSAAQFQVGWDGSVTITTQTPYTHTGSERNTPFSGDKAYQKVTNATKVNGQDVSLAAFVLTDNAGGGYTYYRLRDLGQALGFNVGWSANTGVFIETDRPYDSAN